MDLMKKEVIVLNTTQYQMTDTETGEINEGTSVRYLMTNNLAPCAEEQQKGYKLAKARVSIVLMTSLRFPVSMKLIWMSGSIRTVWQWLLPTVSPSRSH